jgi:nucleotide-binding universal stress UspA family protein
MDQHVRKSNSLERLAGDLRAGHPGVKIRALHAEGKPFVEIIRTASEYKVDLIVMGTHGRTGLPHMLVGSTANRVVRMAHCPVMTVKHPSHKFAMP